MPVSWPAGLPQKQPIGTKDSEQDNIIRTQTDSGPAKVRQRFTTVPRDIDIPMLFTGAERITFDTFWTNCWAQTGASAGTFEWKDPLDGSTKTYRWRERAKPTFTSKLAGASHSTVRWEAVLKLEILPDA